MNFMYGILFAFGCVTMVYGEALQCKLGPETPSSLKGTKPSKDMDGTCMSNLRDQVKREIQASLTYLAMGAYFARDNMNRPGFSKFFFESASEERQHAIKLIEYLLMRGEFTENFNQLFDFTANPDSQEWGTGLKALKHALALEISVTSNIKDIIKKCEDPSENKNANSPNDYHLVDYLTADFLDEQYKGERALAGNISTLKKMTNAHGSLGEWLFDKKLLNGEL